MEHEINRATIWCGSPDMVNESTQSVVFLLIFLLTRQNAGKWTLMYRTAWAINPLVALNLSQRFIQSEDIASRELIESIYRMPTSVRMAPQGVSYLIKNRSNRLRHILTWSAVSPIEAIDLLGPDSVFHPWIIQYAIFVLEYFPIDQVFFYIPQIVQSLRYDSYGLYVSLSQHLLQAISNSSS